jgi:hypothetical protein
MEKREQNLKNRSGKKVQNLRKPNEKREHNLRNLNGKKRT